jgi:hypothetical protein
VIDLEAAADGVLWAYPLLATHRSLSRNPPPSPTGPYLRTRLSTAADRGVVAPNNDTLYGSAFYDLGRGDLLVTVPPMDHPGRYWSVMILDAYTHVAYVCRRLHGTQGTAVVVTYDPSRRPGDDGATVIPVGTPTVWVLVRVLVESPDDLPAAAEVLRSIGLAGPGHPEAGLRQSEDPLVVVANALRCNPPAAWHPPAPEGVAELLDAAVKGGASADVMARAEERLTRPAHDRRSNGWGTRFRGADFGSDVTHRAACAKFSLAAHLPAENRSYVASAEGREARQLRFATGELPPVGGFWSLTLYGPDGFLVDNPIDRFSIGDRTPGLEWEPDGSLVIDIGAEPPARMSNWLPAPPGPCTLALRAYEGSPEVVAATWFPPALTPAAPAR